MSRHEQPKLQTITIEFPNTGIAFMRDVFRLLESTGTITDTHIEFHRSNPAYIPTITLALTETAVCKAIFTLSNAQKLTTEISNMTGIEKKPQHKFGYYTVEQVKKRLKGITIEQLDHVGFNLPWFMGGTHPLIGFLQANLKNKCLYHTFPTGEPWDFILPALPEEIDSQIAIDYQQIRKPKFELVSSEKSSTPLIQIDLVTNSTYATIQERFPNGFHVDELKQTWVTISSPFTVDICLVLNENHGGDWSEQFALTRLQ